MTQIGLSWSHLFSFRSHLPRPSRSGDIWHGGCHDWGEGVSGISWVEAKKGARHCTMLGTDPTNPPKQRVIQPQTPMLLRPRGPGLSKTLPPLPNTYQWCPMEMPDIRLGVGNVQRGPLKQGVGGAVVCRWQEHRNLSSIEKDLWAQKLKTSGQYHNGSSS